MVEAGAVLDAGVEFCRLAGKAAEVSGGLFFEMHGCWELGVILFA